jgi:hypothetical protein
MRLATWNCCAGPLVTKLSALARLGADVAVVPESPKLTSESNRERWFGDNPRKGLAVLTAPDFELTRVDTGFNLPRYVVPLQVRGPCSFLLLAVWAQNDGVDRYVRGLVRAVDLCEPLIISQPTVMLGDFNSNTTWDDEHPKDRNHTALVERLSSLGLFSAYHAYYGEDHGAETRPTFFEYRDEHRPYHIDFCFVPNSWRTALRNVAVGTFAEWSGISDHMPLLLDIEEEAV